MTELIAAPPPRPKRFQARRKRRTSLLAHGEPMVWLTGASLAMCLMMILGLLVLVLERGGGTFWPKPIVEIRTLDGETYLGQVTETGSFEPSETSLEGVPAERLPAVRQYLEQHEGVSLRRKLRTGNYKETGTHFDWVNEYQVESESLPEWAMVFERTTWGRFYGEPTGFIEDGEVVATQPAEVWKLYQEHHPGVLDRLARKHRLEDDDIGAVSKRLEDARLRIFAAEVEHGPRSPEVDAARTREMELRRVSDAELMRLASEIDALDSHNDRYAVRVHIAEGADHDLPLAAIVRAVPSNRLGFGGRLRVYLSRWWEFLSAEPRESNSEGGVYPAIFGTVVMTIIMSVLVVPFGVLAALYMREYAKQGHLVSVVRIAVGNLAGVPSIVFGAFGFGFFCYIIGTSIDDFFYAERLPNPTFGKGGLMWASLTLALLTLPVVIVATEEALSAVPTSMREGSFACGATRWQTIRRIILPRAMPGIMTGMILAIARGAGEVAPLMLVGAAKMAPDLPIDGEPPFIHPSRSFMHLGFHIYDVGFQSQNSEAARPMVFTTTLLLISIVVALNVVAIWVRARLRRKFSGAR